MEEKMRIGVFYRFPDFYILYFKATICEIKRINLILHPKFELTIN